MEIFLWYWFIRHRSRINNNWISRTLPTS